MRVALRGSYIEFVTFMGMTENYPMWFAEELYDNIYMDESRYTYWVPKELRSPDYYDKQLVEDYSVFLRKPNGEIFVTDYDVFSQLYISFRYDAFTNSGIAAFEEDCIEYVECTGGVLTAEYPSWFYEYFTEAVNFPNKETIYFYDSDSPKLVYSHGLFDVNPKGEVSVDVHCVFLRNKFGEIKGLEYGEFLKYYDTDPRIGEWK